MKGTSSAPALSIHTQSLSKWYSHVIALQNVSLHLEAGIWGLLGPNGSGKTTLLRLAAGQLKPSVGHIEVCGTHPFANPDALKLIGLCPEADALYDELTSFEFITIMGKLSGMNHSEAASRSHAMLTKLGLADAKDRKIGTYSRGMRQRVKLAQAMVHEPKILLLDEPLTGTDPTSRHVILDAIRQHADQGGLVVFSTHVLHEVEALTDQVLLLARSQLVAQGSIQEIRLLLDEHPHQIHVQCLKARDLARTLIGQTSISAIRFASATTMVVDTHQPELTYAVLNQELLAQDYGLESITSPDATLQTLFHYLVQRGDRLTLPSKPETVAS